MENFIRFQLDCKPHMIETLISALRFAIQEGEKQANTPARLRKINDWDWALGIIEKHVDSANTIKNWDEDQVI